MHRIRIVLLILIWSPASLLAQSISLRIGQTNGRIAHKIPYPTVNYSGFIVGAGVESPIKTLFEKVNFSLLNEFVYIQKPSKMLILSGTELREHHNYLEYQMLLKTVLSSSSIYILAGGSGAYGLTIRSKLYDFGQPVTQKTIYFNSSYRRRTEFSILFGGGIRLGKNLIDIRYSHGMTNILKYMRWRERTRLVQISSIFLIPIKKNVSLSMVNY